MDVKKLRQAKKWTQWELAKAVGVSVNTIVLWERQVSTPNDENMEKLKEVLGVK